MPAELAPSRIATDQLEDFLLKVPNGDPREALDLGRSALRSSRSSLILDPASGNWKGFLESLACALVCRISVYQVLLVDSL